MKKLIAVSAVAALAATALSAEITFGSWGRGLWVTAANSGYTDENGKWKSAVVTDVHQSWGGAAPRTALAVSGDSENVGFKLDIHGNGMNLGQGDNAYIWVKPVEQVKLSLGRMDDTTLRGDCVNGLWNWDRIGNVGGDEGWTFGGYFQNKGLNALITPAEGLTIGVALPLSLDGSHETVKDVKKNDSDDVENYLTGSLADAWLNSAFVFAYDIQEVGTVKAALKLNTLADHGEWSNVKKDGNGNIVFDEDGNIDYNKGTWGKYAADKDGKPVKTYCNIAAAFDLKAVENLFASLGLNISTLNSDPIVANAYARFNANEQLAIHARVGTKINNHDEKKSAEGSYKTGFGFLAGAGVDYALDGGIGLFADVRYSNGIYNANTSADKTDNITLGAGVTKGFSNGVIGVAFEGTTRSAGCYSYDKSKDGGEFAWEIPVKFEYWF